MKDESKYEQSTLIVVLIVVLAILGPLLYFSIISLIGIGEKVQSGAQTIRLVGFDTPFLYAVVFLLLSYLVGIGYFRPGLLSNRLISQFIPFVVVVGLILVQWRFATDWAKNYMAYLQRVHAVEYILCSEEPLVAVRKTSFANSLSYSRSDIGCARTDSSAQD